MKTVLELKTNDKGEFQWEFRPEASSMLPPFTMAAAVLRLQAMAQEMLVQGAQRNVDTGRISLLNRINGQK